MRGMGPVAAIAFLAFINPFEASTAGRAKAYLGLYPGARLRRGSRASWNPRGRGRVRLIARGVIMAKDAYYRPLYEAKKRYYLENPRVEGTGPGAVRWPPFKEILEDPSKCPKYEACAGRIGRGRPPCRAHLDNMARRWLASLLVSHAAELMKRAEGLPVDSFLAHRGYIPPKRHPEEAPEELLERIAGGLQ